ncbi:MAG: DUF488 domain-containing protein [Candidatus Lokiarchaeota archaeon]|nr:DUF488 domain-containing protein [Candidatus Lokiarchaeota archaeon]
MLYRKQRLLLGLINFLNEQERLDRLTLMKSMFLISQEIPIKFAKYHFHPYKFGPYSAKLYQDLAYMEKNSLITTPDPKTVNLTNSGLKEMEFPKEVKNYVMNVLRTQNTVEELIDFIYCKYPEFSCISERKNIPIPHKRDDKPGFFLIGYEGRDIDEFLNVLIQNNIEILVDIRANPYSMKYNFIGSRLKNFLEKVGIRYISIPELGIESEKRKNLDLISDYLVLFKQYRKNLENKTEFLNKVIRLGKDHRIALMCFEKDPNFCHRGQVGEVLQEKHHQVVSI